MAIDPVRRVIASGGADRAVRLWQLAPPPRTFAVPGREEGSLRGSHDNRVLYADRTGGGFAVADVDRGAVEREPGPVEPLLDRLTSARSGAR